MLGETLPKTHRRLLKASPRSCKIAQDYWKPVPEVSRSPILAKWLWSPRWKNKRRFLDAASPPCPQDLRNNLGRGERYFEKRRSQLTASGPQGKAPPKDSLERYSQNLCRSRRPLLWQGRPPKTKRSQLDDVWKESRRSRSTTSGPQREPPGSCSSRHRAAAALARPRFSLFWRRAPAPNKI